GGRGVMLPAYDVTLAGYVGLASIVAFGLVLLTGVSGQTSFGQASFAGLAAYAAVLVPGQQTLPGLLAGLVLAGVAAWLLGLVTARLEGHFLALCSVAWGISFYALFGTLPFLHGFNGIGDIAPLRIGPFTAADPGVNVAVIWVAAALAWLGARNLLDSRTGRALRTLNGARAMAESMGIDTVRLARGVFVLAALYAALAGFLFAHFQHFISPTPFSLTASIEYLFMVIIGGVANLPGALLGAALVTVLRDQLTDWMPRLTGSAGTFEAMAFSLAVILFLQRAPAGLWPLVARRRAPSGSVAPPRAAAPLPDIAPKLPAVGEVLGVERVSKRFGGLLANDAVSFSVRAGEIVALIGPNGAGKSTLFDIVSGQQAASGGAVRLFGEAVGRLPARRIAALGLARSFQHVKLLPEMSVRDNIALGAHLAGRAGMLRAMLRLDRAEERRLRAMAEAAALRVGLAAWLDTPAGALPLGRQRIVEIARALCLAPRLLLLDEPAAGLRLAEKQALAALLRQLRGEGMTVLLVEHDMGFVMDLADRVVVMEFGRRIAEGAPATVQADPAVLEAYLGGVA
ncbi:MAG TPA: branched-chain amino acid ABC transporter ATP-binding protein/permease, partial [Acetobacteraceae bacterium]|nr:branched-chain amino acid ABC transporter ATP-binding protein/permease [Acetobacteraceae bacterium]